MKAIRQILFVYLFVSCQTIWAVMCLRAHSTDVKFPLNLKLSSAPTAAVNSAGVVLYHVDPISHEIKVLIRKVANEYGGYKWSFAKGRIDAGESAKAAARREVIEELGVDSNIQGWLMDAVGDVTMTRFYIGTPRGEINFSFSSRETEKIALVSLNEARSLLNRERDQIVLQSLAKALADAKGGPFGSLMPVYREDNGSNGGGWYKDEAGVMWYLKRDKAHYPDLQTSAEVISSEIYRHFGYLTPQTFKVQLHGETYSAAKDLGETSRYTDFMDFDTSEVRQIRVVAAYLKDWDRRKNPKNNLILENGELALIDFGGTLGSRPKGEHKPGEAFSRAIGVFESTNDINQIYHDFRINLPSDHPWFAINRQDLESVVGKFRTLTDRKIIGIVEAAQYPRRADRDYMVEALIRRRDAIISQLIPSLKASLLASQSEAKQGSRSQQQKKGSDLIQTARQLVRSATEAFLGTFSQTSGFADIKEFEAALLTRPGLGTKLLQDIQQGQLFEVTIFRTSARRNSILRNGFLNQHSTNRSGSSEFDPVLRNLAEARMMGVSLEEYMQMPPELKAKSALLQPALGQEYERIGRTMYGGDGYVLKDDMLADRLTWTPGDSLNRFISGHGLRREKEYEAGPSKAWDQFFIPWSHRSLAIPFLLVEIHLWNRFSVGGHPYFFTGLSGLPHIQRLQMLTPDQILKFSELWTDERQNYIETQVWGPVNLDHVKAFQFSEEPPSGEFLNELLKRGIEIRDARGLLVNENTFFTTDKPKIWTPGQ